MAIQTTFRTNFARGFPGMVANGEISNRVTRTLEDTDPLPFGAACFGGTNPEEQTTALPNAIFIGFAMSDHGQVVMPGGAADTYRQYQNVGVMQAGAIFVTAGGLIDVGDGIATLNADGSIVAAGTAASTAATGWTAIDAATAAGDVIRVIKRI